MTDQIKRWRAAYKEIEVTDDALATMEPFPSLFANDFVVYLESKGQGPEIMQFFRDMNRELVWVYGNWAKAQRDADAERLLADLLNSARMGGEYEFTTKFLRDYARANNIKVTPYLAKEAPAWLGDLQITEAAPGPLPVPGTKEATQTEVAQIHDEVAA